ncbi:MAG: nif-specific transcriptional activator NifA [Planctomycetota bacterium]|jgi:Nif-specific regulatory protein
MPDAASQAKREVQELSLLFEISRTLERSIDLRDVVGPLLETMAKSMGMLRGTLTLLNRQTGEISIEAAHGLSAKQRERGRYRPGEGVTGKVVQTGRPAVVPRISEEPMFLDRTGARKRVRKEDISFICVPIKLGTEVIGALSADRLFDANVSFEEDVRLLSIIASMIAQAVRLRQSAEEERQRLMEENVRLQEALKDRFRPSNIVGDSRAMQGVYDLIAQVSGSDATVLIHGESGTGKELVAHAIHYSSRRAERPFIRVNCAALPETVLESELFGHEKGAFTGAIARRKGRFELADGGSVFLDEVGDFSSATQIKLLRVLQEREFERVGGTSTVKIDVRVIAATNRELARLIADGKFRRDLYYRLNVFPIHIPPLRERKTDIPLLADHFVEKYAKPNGKLITRVAGTAMDVLMRHDWPGNVRELENCIERAVLLADGNVIHARHLPPSVQAVPGAAASGGSGLQRALDDVEREMILERTRHGPAGQEAPAATEAIPYAQVAFRRISYHSVGSCSPSEHLCLVFWIL